jgi:hypothetical protein
MAGWSIPLDQLAAKLEKDLETTARYATLELYTAVKYDAPVDKGRLRANFNVSQGSVDTTVTDSTDASRMDREIAKVMTLPIGGVMYLSNSLPYARTLEYGLYPNPPKNPTGKTQGGYSIQAPQGYIRINALRFNDYVKRAISK